MPIVIVVGGPAGTGKTTQGELLAKKFNCPFIEGDALHPKANIDKMSRGEPLTDEDRWGWLKQLSQIASEKAEEDKSKIAVVSCSMLKKVYRDYIKQNSSIKDMSFRFVFLYTTFEELLKRVGNRKGHFMKSDMVKSQYDIMEIPEQGELIKNGGEAVSVDTTNKSPDVIEKEIFSDLKL
ncbi:hypothetical protein KGF54_004917 [Candida jiufengensis]|uniref:uncharacterized protein n=1 Tax=Candida jiufengensis TaxID=497108 RepID=UPI0022240C30|nr:uncharacterized protein KGF54_004917 [Candida jiufengensis]KAI5951842.1 hypothetical protein KGF54_004917 [Candida jiufengensis]